MGTMRRSMKDIALNALEGGVLGGGRRTLRDLLGSLSEGPVAVDVWTEDDLGFVLLLHRRGDGPASEELYYSVRDEAGEWQACEHLGGALLGFGVDVPAPLRQALTGSPLSVVSETEALIDTGRGDTEDGYETVRVLTVLVGDDVDVLEVEASSSGSTALLGRRTLEVGAPLVVLVVTPDKRLTVSPRQREGTSLTVIGDALEFSFRAGF
ncbi:hypothetical protein AB9128_11505 [Streptomyces cinereoruber]|uniref:hypothetical protein n=1 Tax=Streptomyces TaxID=1883 RepID=UPI0037F1CBB8